MNESVDLNTCPLLVLASAVNLVLLSCASGHKRGFLGGEFYLLVVFPCLE